MSSILTAYFLRIPNVGDRINPALIRALSGQQAVWTDDFSKPHLLACGSMLPQATAMSSVWGTGAMGPLVVGAPKAENIHALRGPLTAIALRDSGVAVGDVPLGDPAFLAPSLFGLARNMRGTRIGVAAHYRDRFHPIVQRLLQSEESVDLNVHAEPREFIRAMTECRAVISSSLHGLIFAEAIGIPNLWIKLGDEIAGGSFKFTDWFATTKWPQLRPCFPSENDNAASLARQAELHESKIDSAALAAAFPSKAAPTTRRTISTTEGRHRPLPVFVISFNRANMLSRCIAGLRHLQQPTEIIIHDNGSTEPETLSLLADLESSGKKVFRRGSISNADELNQVNETVAAFFADWAEPSRYVVTDCDIDMSIAAPDTLAVYDDLLNRFPRVECVGPMLRIRDIPRDYPLYNRAINRHVEQFWRHTPEIVEASHGAVAILRAPIDTTFALHRAGEPFRRLKPALRVYEPYEALHLDWYRTGADDEYASTSNAAISHWNNASERGRYEDAPLEWGEFNAVRRLPNGTLQAYVVKL